VSIKFPTNPFKIVGPQDYYKYEKTKFSEDYVGENFKSVGWNVYQPFRDKGIDLIISKYICPKGHTDLNKNLNGEKCDICKIDSVKILYFIQVKTRETKETKNKNGEVTKTTFGWTLGTKDFETDPRKLFVMFSNNPDVFLIISINDYLNLYLKTKKPNYFQEYSFRKGNDRDHSISYNYYENMWYFSSKHTKLSINEYLNLEGLKKIHKYTDINNFQKLSDEIVNFKNKYFLTFKKTKTFKINDNEFDEMNKEILKLITKEKKYFLDLKKSNYEKLIKLKQIKMGKGKEKSIFDSIINYFVDPESIKPGN